MKETNIFLEENSVYFSYDKNIGEVVSLSLLSICNYYDPYHMVVRNQLSLNKYVGFFFNRGSYIFVSFLFFFEGFLYLWRIFSLTEKLTGTILEVDQIEEE